MSLLTFRSVAEGSSIGATFQFVSYSAGNFANNRLNFSPVVGFTPISVPNLILWLDASDPSTITKDGTNRVSAWTDKSNAAFGSLVQATGNAQPLWTSNAVNGNAAISFDGGDRLVKNTALMTRPAYPFTIYAVATTADYNTLGIVFAIDNPITHGWYIQTRDAVNGPMFWSVPGFVATCGTVMPLNTAGLIKVVGGVSGLNTITLDGGGAGTSDSSTTSDPLTATAVGDLSSPTAGLKGLICEILVFSSSLSAQEAENIETYLSEKWGTP